MGMALKKNKIKKSGSVSKYKRSYTGIIDSVNADKQSGFVLPDFPLPGSKIKKRIPFFQNNFPELNLRAGDSVRFDLVLDKNSQKSAANLVEQIDRVEEAPVAYLTKDALVRAINKGTRNLAAEALALMGYTVTVRDGWVVKLDAAGNLIEKISKVEESNRSGKIKFD